jgi:hypothetical protein
MSDTEGFRRVLHEWARRQLEQHSDHVGPFEIIDVRMRFEEGFGGGDVTPSDPSITDVRISFRHEGRDCPKLYRRKTYHVATREYEWHPCADVSWGPSDSQDTVKLLNELLAI